MIMAAYAFVAIFTVIVIYTACRFIDHYFRKIEEEDKAMYKAELISTAGDEINWLTQDMLKKTNDFIHDMYKEYEESN